MYSEVKSIFEIKTLDIHMQLNASLIVLEPPITPVSPRGYFEGYAFLKAYEKCYKMSLVCTLTVGTLRRFGVK
jgi:hypothetical protein